MTSTLTCVVYKSLRKAETFIYLPAETKLTELPEELQKLLGETQPVIEIELVPGKKLARYTADEVIASIQQQGYHLQLPPKNSIFF